MITLDSIRLHNWIDTLDGKKVFIFAMASHRVKYSKLDTQGDDGEGKQSQC